MEIKLRRKYRFPVRGRYRSNHNMQTVTKRKKIGYDKHVARFGPPPTVVMVMGPTGKCRFVKLWRPA